MKTGTSKIDSTPIRYNLDISTVKTLEDVINVLDGLGIWQTEKQYKEAPELHKYFKLAKHKQNGKDND